jgi:glycosyltransferase involved in cell wall biosynthesis
VLHVPHPPEARLAWARRHAAPGRFAISGVTHTLSSAGAIDLLHNLLLAPFEPYDALICTSRAVVRMVRTVLEAHADYLRERFGARPARHPRLTLIPLGVNTDRYRPARPEERAAVRAALKIADDEAVVLFVGRLSCHAKAHPFPLFVGLDRASRSTGKKVRLLMAGWAANDGIMKAFVDGARAFAPTIRTDFIDGTRPENRLAVWHAADIFTSPSDNIQETFGLVMVEAMACGLPIVASDWDGYRDLVVHGESGFLCPTYMVRGATLDVPAQFLVGEFNYDHFLAVCNQATTVDIAATAEAFTRLLTDLALRRHMGDAGRRRAVELFDWRHVIRAYEALWQEMDTERTAQAPAAAPTGPMANYPPPEQAFAGYPTAWLDDADTLVTDPGAAGQLGHLLAHPLCNYMPVNRATVGGPLAEVLAAAATPRPLAELIALCPLHTGRASVAWLLKYGLLRPTRSPDVLPSTG